MRLWHATIGVTLLKAIVRRAVRPSGTTDLARHLHRRHPLLRRVAESSIGTNVDVSLAHSHVPLAYSSDRRDMMYSVLALPPAAA